MEKKYQIFISSTYEDLKEERKKDIWDGGLNIEQCIRGKWNGQDSTVESISDEFAEYALNLVVTNIVLLVGIYKDTK